MPTCFTSVLLANQDFVMAELDPLPSGQHRRPLHVRSCLHGAAGPHAPDSLSETCHLRVLQWSCFVVVCVRGGSMGASCSRWTSRQLPSSFRRTDAPEMRWRYHPERR